MEGGRDGEDKSEREIERDPFDMVPERGMNGRIFFFFFFLFEKRTREANGLPP